MIRNILRKIYYMIPISDNQRVRIYNLLHKNIKENRAGSTIENKTDIYKQAYPKFNIAEPKKVSVIIPNYNYADYIIERIDSILFQTYPIYELIILDDCSRDNSVEIIKNKIDSLQVDLPVRLVINEKNSGNVFAQWKKAFQEATGEYVWIAEADDSCDSHFLEAVMKGFDDPEVIMSYCESLTMDEQNNILMGNLRPWIDIFQCGKWNQDYIKDGIQEIIETLCINNTIANVSSVVFKNGNYLKYIEEAKRFKLAGDWYVYMRILEHGKIAYDSRSLNYHRMQQQGMTLSTKHEVEYNEIVYLQDYALNHYPISEETKKKVLERREKERIRFGL